MLFNLYISISILLLNLSANLLSKLVTKENPENTVDKMSPKHYNIIYSLRSTTFLFHLENKEGP